MKKDTSRKVIGRIKTVGFLVREEEWYNVIAKDDEYYTTDLVVDEAKGIKGVHFIPGRRFSLYKPKACTHDSISDETASENIPFCIPVRYVNEWCPV